MSFPGEGIETREVIALAGVDPTRVLPESILDQVIERHGSTVRIVRFTAITAAGTMRVSLDVAT